MSCPVRVWGAREALTLSARLAPPGRGWADHGDRGSHGCLEAALSSIGSGRQTWSLAKAPAPRSPHSQETCPSGPGPGVGAPHAVALGAWALHRAGAPFPALPSLFLLLGRIPRGPTGSVVARQGAREGRPQPSHPARTPAAGRPSLSPALPAGVIPLPGKQWRPGNRLPATSTQGPEGSRWRGRGGGQVPGELGRPFSPGSPLSLPRPARPRPDLRPDPEGVLCSLGFMATLHLPHQSPSTWGPCFTKQ